MEDLAVVTCHFNWNNSRVLDRLLIEFLQEMNEQKITVYGIELSLTGNFITKDLPTWHRVLAKKHNISLQKSCLINKVVQTLPDNFTKVAWLDRDIYFNNNNWYRETSEKLDQYTAVQMFTRCHWLDSNNEIYMSADSYFSEYREELHDGFALAARRDLWKNGGLYPYTPLGSGDALFVRAAKNLQYDPRPLMHALALQAANLPYIVKWDQDVRKYINNNVSIISGDVFHKWHGSIENRCYGSRANILKDVIIEEHLFINNNGILEFKNISDTFLKELENYFINRKDDSTG